MTKNTETLKDIRRDFDAFDETILEYIDNSGNINPEFYKKRAEFEQRLENWYKNHNAE